MWGPCDKVFISILPWTSTPSLVQSISGAGKPTAEQERVVFSPTEITADIGCCTKEALTASRRGNTQHVKYHCETILIVYDTGTYAH